MFFKILIPDAFLLACAFAAAIVGRYIDGVLGVTSYQSTLTIIIGITLLALGIGLRSWAIHAYYRHLVRVFEVRSQHVLVQDGPFAFSRNPLYLSMWSIMFGAAFVMGTFTGMIFSVASVLWWSGWTYLVEEKSLRRKFGEDYVVYCQQIPRWLGRPKRPSADANSKKY